MKTSPSSRRVLQRWLALACGLLLSWASLGRAAEPTPGSPSARQQVEVRRGDTLDRVIRRTLPDLGLKPEFVRAAFIELNPQAFVRGRSHQLRAGAPLIVPSQQDLRQRALNQYPALGELMQDPAGTSTKPDRSEEIRLRWIRYP